MGRGAELIGFVLFFDIVVIDGYILLTDPLGNVQPSDVGLNATSPLWVTTNARPAAMTGDML